ncbi:hypothetical protein HgNV_014 [Homarus gammarus nudivirus]|uniref:Uncharacterized protein n=1 Tax=Homarus gammarus nudivirus TaxID=2509616 RepID=A0A411HB57_9VIRU|nr:hypothetical protein KM727_gp14 [Homarus gammarus nudivirus]QBB28619.1 hypothetical protein HgNV_014 [Homarus gammarus nudivirus]
MSPLRKRQKLTNAKFLTFDCICSAVTDKQIRLVLVPDKLSCILKNYKKYLQMRNMWTNLSVDYRNVIDRNIQYPDDNIHKVKFIESSNRYGDLVALGGSFNNKYVNLQIFSSQNKCSFYKYFEHMCMSEFVGFVNQHVFNDNYAELLENSAAVVKSIKTCNF